MSVDFRYRPLEHGFVVGLFLPLALLLAPVVFLDAQQLFSDSRVYYLMPFFAAAGVVTFLLAARLYPFYLGHARGLHFTHGVLFGGWLCGAMLLWAASPSRPFVNRLLVAVFGGALLVGFWLWIGALLGYAAQQRRSEERVNDLGPA